MVKVLDPESPEEPVEHHPALRGAERGQGVGDARTGILVDVDEDESVFFRNKHAFYQVWVKK